MQQHNPHQSASNAYSNNRAASLGSPRAMEAQILLKAATKLNLLRTRIVNGEKPSLIEMSEALEYNRKLWVVFSDSMNDDDHDLPVEIKNNIASLAGFVFKQTLKLTAKPTPENFDSLMNINRQVASGLMSASKSTETAMPAPHTSDTSSEPVKQSFEA